MTCICGHAPDEHDRDRECTVDDCLCFYYDPDPDAED